MYTKANLVHCDLSPFNILYYKEKPYLIDLGQAVLLDHPHAIEFLKRDIKNICQYFQRYKLNNDPVEIFENITKQKW